LDSVKFHRMLPAMDAPPLVLHLAAAIRDAAGTALRPGAVAVQGGRILATGRAEELRRELGRAVDLECDHGRALLLPAFVNAHAHLDLAGVGPRPYAGDFVDWVGVVIRERPQQPDAIAAAVHAGLRAARAAGVGWIGDIAASEAAVEARALAPPDAFVPGVSWLEVFGIGRRAAAGADAAERRLVALRGGLPPRADLRIDLQPHAPYSAGLAVFERAAALGAPSTHLAETHAEQEFVARAAGPFRDLLARVREWDDTIEPLGSSPIRALGPLLERAPWVVAHCNHVDDEDLEVLARVRGLAVAYCPIASEYFDHRGHRYREMLARGIEVCLGTDSALCQPADASQPHGILAPCRRLFARDRTDPATLLAMATTSGARALRLPAGAATLAPGAPARLQTIPIDDDPGDPWLQVLEEPSRDARGILP
jgi:cytosine/adenosine deaminase-related metal-dependent hydrolase